MLGTCWLLALASGTCALLALASKQGQGAPARWVMVFKCCARVSEGGHIRVLLWMCPCRKLLLSMAPAGNFAFDSHHRNI